MTTKSSSGDQAPIGPQPVIRDPEAPSIDELRRQQIEEKRQAQEAATTA